MHVQGQASGVCLANKVSKPIWVAREGVEELLLLDAQFCHLGSLEVHALHLAHCASWI